VKNKCEGDKLHQRNTSGVKGVYKDRSGKWKILITKSNWKFFKTIEEAAQYKKICPFYSVT
jgi:hypothetical protein